MRISARAADRAAGAHAADEVRDFPFGVIPDFRAGGAVMRLGIHRIFVLVRIVGVGNFARKFFRHRIVAARIFRFHGRGANDHFGAESFQHIDFFARLLVRDGENNFVAAHGGDQRERHSGVAGSALDDRAAGLQQSFALGFVNHRDGDAVLHRAAGIQIIGLHPHLGGKVAARCGSGESAACCRSRQGCCCTSLRGLFQKTLRVNTRGASGPSQSRVE